MKRSYIAGIVLGATALIAGSAAYAASTSIDFETYTLGNIHLQQGWSKSGPYDVAVESNTYAIPTFGSQVLRISNALTSGSFGDQTFSTSLADEAGETNAQASPYSGGTRQNYFEASFDIASTLPTEQLGLGMTVSPDRGDGARMSYVRFEDRSDGIHVLFYDYQDATPQGTLAAPADGCSNEDAFVFSDIATITRSPHTIKITMEFVDGPANDIVQVYVDGTLIHTGTSWEDYFRWCTESGGGVINDATADVSRTVDSLLFRVSGPAAPATLGKGFLIDNLSLESGQAVPVLGYPTTRNDCMKDGWKNFTNPAFRNQGQCVAFIESHSSKNH